jgi:DNA-binding transcriptional ArsR family regulator
VEIERKAYQFAIDPAYLQAFIVSHLSFMWDSYLAREWDRIKPMLSDAVRAFQQLDFTNMSKLEVAQLITDQELEPWMHEQIEGCQRLIFIPSAHIGPYVSKFDYLNGTLGIIFGARLPKGSLMDAPDLSRNEILVRLSALAEDNRLRILKYIADNGEQRSQDIMTALEFSQSATSRHLKQLSATGILVERRCEGAKCYRLNRERLDETIKATRSFLLGEELLSYSYPRERTKAFA